MSVLSNIGGRTKVLMACALAACVVACILVGYWLSGPGEAHAPEEAIRAAETLRKEMGGGTQPTNDQGVPRDAQSPPDTKAGRIELKPRGG